MAELTPPDKAETQQGETTSEESRPRLVPALDSLSDGTAGQDSLGFSNDVADACCDTDALREFVAELAVNEAVDRPRILNSGNTEAGRILPVQRAFAKYLVDRQIEAPLIVDVGVGDGAATVKDFAHALSEAGIRDATIVGIDASPRRVRAAEMLVSAGKLPPGIAVMFRQGDITASVEAPYSVSSVLDQLYAEGVTSKNRADIATSSNLINAFRNERDEYLARESLNAGITSDGIVGIGTGDGQSISYHPNLRMRLYNSTDPHTQVKMLDMEKMPHYQIGGRSAQEKIEGSFAQTIKAATAR